MIRMNRVINFKCYINLFKNVGSPFDIVRYAIEKIICNIEL